VQVGGRAKIDIDWAVDSSDHNADFRTLRGVDRLGGADVGDERRVRLAIKTDDVNAGADHLHAAVECRLS